MIDDCYVVQDSYNSDHYPLAVTISLPVPGASQESWVSPPICLPKLDLGKVTPTDIESFQSSIESYLCSINFVTMVLFAVVMPHVIEVIIKLKLNHCIIIHIILINATKQCFSQRRPNSNFKKCVPGWNEYVFESKAAASDALYLWCQWNKPKFGPLFDLMRRIYSGQVQICYTLLPSTGKTNSG